MSFWQEIKTTSALAGKAPPHHDRWGCLTVGWRYRESAGEDACGLRTKVCRKQTVRRWIRQKTSLSASLLLSNLCSGSKNSSLCWAILGVIRGFFRGLGAGSLKSLCIRFLIVLVVTLISSCIDLFISDEEMNGCFWQSCLILHPSWEWWYGVCHFFSREKD